MSSQRENTVARVVDEDIAAADDRHIADHDKLSPADLNLVRKKRMDANRLGFGVLLLFFRRHGRFPRDASEIDTVSTDAIAKALGVPVTQFDVTDLEDRTLKRHRAEIRSLVGYREATVADGEALTDWLRDHAVADNRDIEQMTRALERRCREIKIEPPGAERADRMVRAALNAYDERFCRDIHAQLKPGVRGRLDALLRPASSETKTAANEDADGLVPAVLMQLRSDPGGPSVNSLQIELAKLGLVRNLELPAGLFDRARPHEIERFRRQVAVEAPYFPGFRHPRLVLQNLGNL